MADILSQAEVNALLTALEPVFLPNTPESSGTNGLAGSDELPSRSVPADADPVQWIESLLECFPMYLTATLSKKIQMTFEIKAIGQRRFSYREFSRTARPCFLQLMESKQTSNRLAYALDHSILLTMIDRLLGGNPNELEADPEAALTEIEQVIVWIITDLVMAGLQKTFRELGVRDLQLAKINPDPFHDCGIDGDEQIVCCDFEVAVGGKRGPMTICMPLVELTFLNKKLSETKSPHLRSFQNPVLSREQQQDREDSTIQTCEAIVNLAETTLTNGEVRNLAIGDVIVTDSKANDGVEMTVFGHDRFRVIPGVVNGRRAVQLEKQIDPPPTDQEQGSPSPERKRD